VICTESLRSAKVDPGNVMIWDETGGGTRTTTLTVLPKAQGLYHKASIESGPTRYHDPKRRMQIRQRSLPQERLVWREIPAVFQLP